MNIRIATTTEGDKLKLVKVYRCCECPNVKQIDQRDNPGQIRCHYCELLDREMRSYSGEIPEACPLPSLLEISQGIGMISGLLPPTPPLTYPVKGGDGPDRFDPTTSLGPDWAKQRETEESEPTEEDEEALRQLKLSLLGNVGNLVANAIFLKPHLRGIQDALKKSAQADLIRAILDCERFLEELPAGARGESVCQYLDRLKEALWETLEIKTDQEETTEAEDPALLDVLKELTNQNVTVDLEHRVCRLLLTPEDFARLIDAAEKAGADVDYWHTVWDREGLGEVVE